MHASTADLLTQAIDEIAQQGYSIIDSFLPEEEIASLATIIRNKWEAGHMVSAKTGKTGLKNQSIRGDYIAWLDEQDQSPAVQSYFRQMELLRLRLNMQLFLNVQELETHVAVYPIGSAYQKHLDQFSHGNQLELQHRQLSAVLYLNQNWQTDNGGALRLHLSNTQDDNHFIDVLPIAGRIVLFLSAKFWHEVLPANRERLSLTGWFRTRNHRLI